MRIGVNTWVWTSPVDDDWLAEGVPRIASWGFDLVELPVEQIGDWDPARTRDLLDAHGLGATVCAVMPDGRDLTGDDPDLVAPTQDYLRAVVDAAATVGSGVVAGPIYAPVGRTWRLDDAGRDAVLGRVADNLRPVAEEAAARGVRLAVEPLNRYETSLVNTVAQAVDLVERVGSDGCGIAVDTFHLNIEEQDPAAAIRAAGPHLAHVQACANDRGAPGADHLDWTAILGALEAVGYDGPICIESFTAENATIATAASIWRPLARTQDAIATDGLAFLREAAAGATAGVRS